MIFCMYSLIIFLIIFFVIYNFICIYLRGLVIVDLKSLKVGDHWVPLVARSPADVVTGSIHFVISKTSFKVCISCMIKVIIFI